MIKLSKENEIAILTLNRAEKSNALHPKMIGQIKSELGKISDDKETKALIITGEGNSFCAGADLEYLDSLQNYSSIENERDSENLAEMFLQIYKLPIITIAAVNGPAIAGGCGLASVCDFIVADSNQAKFGYTEVKIGFIPAIVSIFMMRKIGLGASKKLFLTGEILNAQEATNIGLVDYKAENALDEAKSLANKLSCNSQSSYSFTKQMLNEISTINIDDAVDYCIRLNTISRSTKDFNDRIKKFLNK